LFSKAFANTLINNPNSCITVQHVVRQVTIALVRSQQQRPQFGKIAGLANEGGTFLFYTK